MMDKDNTPLTLNGVQYRAELVLQNGKAGPVIEVGLDEINVDGKPEHHVQCNEIDKKFLSAPVILFKQNGKYTVLLGHLNAEKQRSTPADKQAPKIKGHLISSVALKNSKPVPVSDIKEIESIPVRSNQRPEFANRARDSDERTSRYAGNGPARYPAAYRK